MTRHRWPSRPIEDRFWEKVEKTDTCWLWIGGRTAPGMHGRTFANGQKVVASRVSWEMHYGPIPPGMFVCHSCDNPPCVRPDHLFLGTHRANMIDAARKGRTGPQIRDWSLCKNGHELAETGYVNPSTGRRRCRICAIAGRRRRAANLTPEQRAAINDLRRAVPRRPSTPEQRLQQRDRQRRYRERHKGKTPQATKRAAERLDGAMGGTG